jgi:hypothetical protein
MSNRRRIIIILSSVTLGSIASFFIVRSRMGNLSPDNYKQLIFNFVFAIAIVVGIAILFGRMNKKDK